MLSIVLEDRILTNSDSPELLAAAHQMFMEAQLDPLYKELFPDIAYRFRTIVDEMTIKGENLAKQNGYPVGGQKGMGAVVAAITVGTLAGLCGVSIDEYKPSVKPVAEECRRATTELMNHPDVRNDTESN